MINVTEDIQSLTDFKKKTTDFIHNLKKTGRPTVLTVNGKAEIVVMDASTYQKIQEKIELEESAEQIRQSLKEFEEGKSLPAEEVFDKLRQIIKKNK